MKDLGGIQQTAIVFWIIPRFLRDALYDFIATKRYAVFGKKESCYLPSPELEDRFIQD
jgi:predicted DCC family thiol-disulfide oxidoreductase YuxK